MADVHSKEVRSFNMSRIKGKGTNPELIVRRYLFSRRFRYRLNKKDLPGKPDVVLAKFNTVVMINGCFWHGHANCRYAHLPKTRTDWWEAKINKTKITDDNAIQSLLTMGWNVIILWECALKKRTKETALARLEEIINNNLNIKSNLIYISFDGH